MLGWFSAEAARASRWKRSSAWASCGDVFGEELEGDEAAELDVFGLVDHAHAAAAEFFEDAIVRDGLADHWSVIVGLWAE